MVTFIFSVVISYLFFFFFQSVFSIFSVNEAFGNKRELLLMIFALTGGAKIALGLTACVGLFSVSISNNESKYDTSNVAKLGVMGVT